MKNLKSCTLPCVVALVWMHLTTLSTLFMIHSPYVVVFLKSTHEILYSKIFTHTPLFESKILKVFFFTTLCIFRSDVVVSVSLFFLVIEFFHKFVEFKLVDLHQHNLHRSKSTKLFLGEIVLSECLMVSFFHNTQKSPSNTVCKKILILVYLVL